MAAGQGSYAGTAYIQFLPSFDGIVNSISREAAKWGQAAGKVFTDTFNRAVRDGTRNIGLGPSDANTARQGDQVAGKFADGFKARLAAALRALPDVKLNADATDADRKLAELRAELVALSGKRIGVDINDTDALAKVAEVVAALRVLGAESPHVRVKVDTAAATGELAAIAAEADLANGTGSSGLRGLLSSVTGLAGELEGGGAAGGPSLTAGLGFLATALIPLGGLALGGLSTLPGILTGIGAAVGGAVVAYKGLAPVIKAYQTAQQAAKDATIAQAQAADTAGKSLKQIKQDQTNASNAARKAADAQAAYQLALSNTTPAAQGFIGFLTGTLLPKLRALRSQITSGVLAGLLPGLTGAFRDFLPFLDNLARLAQPVGKALGGIADAFLHFLGEPQSMQEFNALVKSGLGFLQDMAGAAISFLDAVGRIGIQAQPIVKALGYWIERAANAFDSWVANGGFQRFLNWLQKNGPGLVSTVVQFLRYVGKLVLIMAPLGKIALDMAAGLAVMAYNFAVAVKTIIRWGGDAVAFFRGPFVDAFLTVGRFFSRMWDDMKGYAASAWGWLNGNVFQPIVTFFTSAIPGALNTAVAWMAGLPGRIAGALGGLWGALTSGWGDLAGWVQRNVINPVENAFEAIPTALGNIGSSIGSGIVSGLRSAWDIFARGWNATVGRIHIPGTSIGVPDLPVLHTGGVVPGPAGADVLAVLQAGEVVLSRAQVAQMGGPVDMTVPAAAGGRGAPLIGEMVVTALNPARAAREFVDRAAWLDKTAGR